MTLRSEDLADWMQRLLRASNAGLNGNVERAIPILSAAGVPALIREVAQLRAVLGTCAGFIAGCADDYTPGEWRQSRAFAIGEQIAAVLESEP